MEREREERGRKGERKRVMHTHISQIHTYYNVTYIQVLHVYNITTQGNTLTTYTHTC